MAPVVPPDGWTVADLPVEGPATVQSVKASLSITDASDDVALGEGVDAANVFIRRLPKCYGVTADTGWPADVVKGANMLSSRLWRRRNSPSGVEAFGDQGAVYVQRNDPDVALLLGLGNYAPPQVG